MILPCKDQGIRYRQFKWTRGDGFIHLGSDRNCNEGDSVYTISDGVCIYSKKVPGFGSFGSKGGVVLIESNINGQFYTILYGHINSDIKEGDEVKKGDLIGKIIKYEYMSKGVKIRADHLHWGAWIGGFIPPFPWGYSTQLGNWFDPNKLLV
jgi:murein DD-endopeptidase MepM/ murein hydrolase activator NlpD